MPHYRCNNLLTALLTVILTYTSSPVIADNEIHLSCFFDKQSAQTKALSELLITAFSNLNIQLFFHKQPPLRGIASANRGITDGYCIRGKHFSEAPEAKDFIQLETALTRTDIVIWGRDKSLKLPDAQQPFNSDYRIGYLRGFIWPEKYLKQKGANSPIALTSTQLGIKMLAAGRLDLYVGIEPFIEGTVAELWKSPPVYSLGKVTSINSFMYLHKRHQQIIPQLDSQFKTLIEASGGPFVHP
jgi:hypothetical protein